MRTIIELTAQQLEALDRWRRREGISRAEAIRRAVTAHIGTQGATDARQAFGLWRDRPVDSLTYERGLRNEWNRPASRTRQR